MARSPGCPPAETLAAFMDAGPSWRTRRALVAHLDGCSRCRTALAYAGQFEASLTPEPATQAHSPWWRLAVVTPRFAIPAGVTFALLVTLLATPTFGPPIVSWFTGGPSIGLLTTEAVVSPLFLEQSGSSFSDHRWSGQTNSFSFGAGPTPVQTAFRVGVQLVDFRVGLEEGRLQDASAALQNLRSLGRSSGGELSSNRWSSLEEALSAGVAKERIVEELALLDGELSETLDPLALDLGRWTEAGRLAAASHHTRYFADPHFRAVLANLTERGLSLPVEQALDAIRTNTSPTPSETDFAELEKGFRQLILLH